MARGRICVAQIGTPHGVRGEVRLRIFTEEPDAVLELSPLQSEDGARSFAIETLRPGKDHFIARLHGVADRDAAERLRDMRLYVARDSLPAIDEEETFYHADLVGLAAAGADGRPYGTIVAVHNFGAGDLLEIQPEHGAAVMLPFTTQNVPLVDVAGGRVVIAPPEGLFGGGTAGQVPSRPARSRSPAAAKRRRPGGR
jgi:16S rRNA processing protein RimM